MPSAEEGWVVRDASGGTSEGDGFGFFSASGQWHHEWTASERLSIRRAAEGKAESSPGVVESSTKWEAACFAAAVSERLGRIPKAGSTLTYFTDNRGPKDAWAAGRSKAKAVNDYFRLIAFRAAKCGLVVVVRFHPRTNLWAMAADQLSHGVGSQASTLTGRSQTSVTPVLSPDVTAALLPK